jgi:cobalt-zinc-cadmium efflux system protein
VLHDHAKSERHSGHHHSPGVHTHAPADFGRAFVIGITLNAAYVLAEAFYGIA